MIMSNLEMVHSDISGPCEVQSLGGARYFLSIIDEIDVQFCLDLIFEKQF